MKRTFNCFILAAACLAALCLAACDDKDDIPVNEEPGVLPPDPIGVYSFDGEQGIIADGVYTQDEYDIQFVFSPKMMTSAVDTYFLVGVHNYWIGQRIDCERVFHNDDYVFVYEDPWYLYTQYKKVTGTVLIEQQGTRFTVQLDLRLHDGKPFTAAFEGELRNGLDTEE